MQWRRPCCMSTQWMGGHLKAFLCISPVVSCVKISSRDLQTVQRPVGPAEPDECCWGCIDRLSFCEEILTVLRISMSCWRFLLRRCYSFSSDGGLCELEDLLASCEMPITLATPPATSRLVCGYAERKMKERNESWGWSCSWTSCLRIRSLERSYRNNDRPQLDKRSTLSPGQCYITTLFERRIYQTDHARGS
jgi:hypothetical protein